MSSDEGGEAVRFLPDGPTALFVVKTMPVRAHRRRLCPLRQHSLDRYGRRSRNCRDRTFGAFTPGPRYRVRGQPDAASLTRQPGGHRAPNEKGEIRVRPCRGEVEKNQENNPDIP